VVSVTYRYQFAYRSINDRQYAIRQLRLSNPGNPEQGVDVDAYLDSGAEGSVFNGLFLEALGIQLVNGQSKNYASTIGASVRCYLHSVQLSHPELGAFNLEVAFSELPIRRNLLGRDFFYYAQVGFRERYLQFYLTPTP